MTIAAGPDPRRQTAPPVVTVIYQRPAHREMCGTWIVACCPYCRRQHTHIAHDRLTAPGLRIAHCTRETRTPSYYRLTRKKT
ncbi:MAG: hypothetical protein JWO67_988 [Streptosporangiaceae bacterium]|nr:hypothetical protein [Streptosporangiaceae bacterium]